MINALLSLYSPKYPSALIYMLQSTEYRLGPYLRWYWRTVDFNAVAKRRQLEKTKAAKLLLLALWAGIILQVGIGAAVIVLRYTDHMNGGLAYGLALIVSYPIVWAHLIALPLAAGRLVVVKPQEYRKVKKSEKVFAGHTGTKIAVAGSYGKTTMKELLLTVLGEGKKVAATPANKNVAVSHAQFAASLEGDEDVLVIEYGEGAPGDVRRFVATTHPDIGVITGLAPAHLDRYKTVQAAGEDIFTLAKKLKKADVYVNGESPLAKPFIKSSYQQYTSGGVGGWKVGNLKVHLEGLEFTLKKGKKSFSLKSNLLGRHQVGPLAVAAVLADRLGLTKQQIETGISKTMPFEHRMQPYLLGGAWVIDDTYNGNLEGMRAGLLLLSELKAKRKIYVTPGLVDQGKETIRVHRELGETIARINPEVVVLMKNSVTDYILAGIDAVGYTGELVIEDNPLEFYSNLDQFVAVGDIVLLQNDWTDNYL